MLIESKFQGSGTNQPPLILRSVWDWREQFSEKDISFFCNPLYDDSFTGSLKPSTGLSNLEIWTQCYFRWLPDLEIRNGGKPQIDLYCRFLVAEILQKQQGDINGKLNRNKEEYTELIKRVNSFFPFSNYSGVRSNDPINNLILSGDMMDSQSILNFND